MEFDEPEITRPWTEAEWERSFQRSDVRSAKYGELLETLQDDPDRDAIIAREMGWKGHPIFEHSEVIDEDTLNELRASEAALEATAAYARAMEWTVAVGRALDPRAGDDDTAIESDDPIIEARFNSLIVPLKLAAGHAMGYHDDVLCANIVCCCKALEGVERSLGAMKSILTEERLARATVLPVIDEGTAIRQLIDDRITELRQRVWWDCGAGQ